MNKLWTVYSQTYLSFPANAITSAQTALQNKHERGCLMYVSVGMPLGGTNALYHQTLYRKTGWSIFTANIVKIFVSSILLALTYIKWYFNNIMATIFYCQYFLFILNRHWQKLIITSIVWQNTIMRSTSLIQQNNKLTWPYQQ